MGTTLTGTKPKDTYDSLIKVGDNGPISGTAKTLSDGLGNDLPISVSTSSVGIGTSAPLSKLHVFGSQAGASPTAMLRVGNSGTGYMARILLTDETTADGNIVFQGSAASLGAQYIGFGIGANLDTLKLTGDGYLRMAASTSGIQFNGDTAAANALDDYEEGTWTPTFTDTLGNNVTATNVGTYTKIGRQVTLSLTTTWSNKSAAGAGSLVYMSGVPFNMNNKANGIVTYYDDMNLTTVGAFTIANAGTSLCYFPIQDNAVEASFLTFGETTNTSTFWFTLTYFV
jgi:hypothetical protein